MPFDLKGKNEKQLVSIVVEKETVSCEHIERFFFYCRCHFHYINRLPKHSTCQLELPTVFYTTHHNAHRLPGFSCLLVLLRQLVLLFLFSAAFETVLLRCLLIFQLLMLPLMRQNPLWAR